MNRFVLTGDLITNVPDLDAQHRKLFEFANQVVDPSTLDQGADFFLKVVTFLAGYVDYHFAAEEMIMLETQFPRFELHHKWHVQFKSQVAEIAELAMNSGVSKALKLKVSFAVENWLLDHIRISDRELAKFLVHQRGTNAIVMPNAKRLKTAGLISKDFNEALLNA
jgi:hemerythrin